MDSSLKLTEAANEVIGTLRGRLNDQNSADVLGASAIAYAGASKGIRRLAEDLDVVVPPPDLVRLHAQLVEAMKALASEQAQTATILARMSCAEEKSLGIPCDRNNRILRGSAALRSIPADAEPALRAARQRAQTMLGDQGVSLPDV